MAGTHPDRHLIRQVANYWASWVGLRQSSLQFPGVQVAVLHDDAIVMSKAYGCATLEGQIVLTPSHLFRIASHSKTFTATAILQLVERGKLRLDDAVGVWVPWLKDSQSPHVASIQVRELLSHGGGLIRDGQDGDFWQLYRPFPQVEQLDDLLGPQANTYSRNEHFKYSNMGFTLLGLVIEKASGMPYNDYVQQHIVQPLGLENTGPELDPSRIDNYASGYTAETFGLPRRSIEHVNTAVMSSATGFYSTAEDLCRYCAGHFFGNDILLGDDLKRLAHREEWKVEGNDGEGYGLGFSVTTIGKRRIVGHGGGYPGHITSTMFDPTAKIAAVALVNSLGSPAEEMTTSAFKLLNMAEKDNTTDSPPGMDLGRYCGRYANIWGVVDIAQFGNQLYLLWPDQPNPSHNAAKLEIHEGQLRLPLVNGYSSGGEFLHFDFEGEKPRSVRAESGMTWLREDHYIAAVARTAHITLGWNNIA